MRKSVSIISLLAWLAVSGATSYATSINGKLTCANDGTPISGVRLSITGLGTCGVFPPDGVQTTDANGDYIFYLHDCSGFLTICVDTTTLPAGATLNEPRCIEFEEVSSRTFNWTVSGGFCEPPPPPGSIGDTVYCDTNGNGTQDAGEPGIPGVTVLLSGTVTASTTTDANGHYLFSNLPAGGYVVTVDTTSVPQGCSVPVCLLSVPVALTAGQTYLDADFCFTPPPPPPGSIGDTVYCDANGNGTQDAGEPGIPGVTVILSGTVAATTTTDANGHYLFSNLPAGVYGVTVDTASVPQDCSVPVCRPSVSVTLAAGQTFLDADFCFTQPPSGPGTGTPGYWMNHPEAWPVNSIVIGGITYSKDLAIALMKLPVSKDKRLTMFPNLVCAKLNLLIGTDSSCIAATIAAADAWWATYSAAPVAASSAAWAMGGPLATTLDNYNNGLMCAPHRD